MTDRLDGLKDSTTAICPSEIIWVKGFAKGWAKLSLEQREKFKRQWGNCQKFCDLLDEINFIFDGNPSPELAVATCRAWKQKFPFGVWGASKNNAADFQKGGGG